MIPIDMSIIAEIWKEYQASQKVNKAFEIALGEYGTKEIAGPEHNPQILKYFKESGFDQITDDETSWCSAFVTWCVMKAGMPGTGSLAARSWMNWGTRVFDPQLGDIAVFWRNHPTGWEGHVGFFVRQNGTHVWVLGGNQSNQVNIQSYPGTQLLGYRRFVR